MNRGDKFSHFLPLWIFTALMIIAAGRVLGIAGVHAFEDPWEGRRYNLVFACALILAGGLASFLHLGKKARALRALCGLTRSWLSREALFAAIFFGLTATAAALDAAGRGGIPLTLSLYGSCCLGVLLLIAVGMLYHLGHQLTWRGFSNVVGPLASGLCLGACFMMSEVAEEGIGFGFWVLWILDVILYGMRFFAYLRAGSRGRPYLFPELRSWVFGGYVLRLLSSTAASMGFVMGEPTAAFIFVALSVVIDRFCLYAGAAQATPGSEMHRLKDERMKAAVSGESPPGP